MPDDGQMMNTFKNGDWYIRLLDAGATLVVIAMALTAILPSLQHITDKTRFTEVLMALQIGKIALVEQQAIGEPIPTHNDIGGQYGLSGNINGETYVLTGKLYGNGIPFSLSIAPSVIQGEPVGSVNWLCGHHGARAGWSGSRQGPGTDLPKHEIPFVCRSPSVRIAP